NWSSCSRSIPGSSSLPSIGAYVSSRRENISIRPAFQIQTSLTASFLYTSSLSIAPRVQATSMARSHRSGLGLSPNFQQPLIVGPRDVSEDDDVIVLES